MSLNHAAKSARRLARYLLLFEIFINAIQFGLIFVAIGHDANSSSECFTGNLTGICKTSHDTTPLGTWSNMPSATTELMGNTSYRNTLFFSTSSSLFNVGLQVGCISPSNTAGALLKLQSATYDQTLRTNATVFADVGNTIFIDNSANWPCPGNLQNSQVALPTQANGIALIFRVVGVGGGGVGDNPRFSYVNMFLSQQIERGYSIDVTSITTTTFRLFAFAVPTAVAVSTVFNFEWIATNSSNSAGICGTLTDVCIQHGSNSCTIAAGAFNCNVIVTYPTAFTGTVDVVATSKNVAVTQTLFVGSMDFLMAQTLTV